jgi:hypothetical protein
MIVARLQTGIAVIVRVMVVEDITGVESIMLNHRTFIMQMNFTTVHGVIHVPWLTRMTAKRLMSVIKDITRVMTRLMGVAKRATLAKVIARVIVRVRSDLQMRFLWVAWRVTLAKVLLDTLMRIMTYVELGMNLV